MKKKYYDDALCYFSEVIFNVLGESAFMNNIILRDPQGKLTLIINDENFDSKKMNKISELITAEIPSYVDPDYVVATPEQLFDDSLSNHENVINLDLKINGVFKEIKLLERRIVGSDWLTKVNEQPTKPARIVFSSIKGGVGRTTAICVIAAMYASQGKRILTIDMDLEAPGLGSMLLKPDTLPKFGLLDYFVESNLENIDERFFVDLVGSSWLSEGKGRIDVIPALGSLSLSNPENVLGKISRAYMGGGVFGSTFMSQVKYLIDFYSERNRYDLILIDARSGLHETTASVLVGLGANIFFFGMNQPQTLAGFDLLFSHLALFNSAGQKWAEKLKFIHAKADPKKNNGFSNTIEDKIKNYFYHEEKGISNIDVSDLSDTFEVEWKNEEEEISINITEGIDEKNHVITINNEFLFHEFDPISNPDLLTSDVCRVIYGSLLEEVESIIKDSASMEVYFD